MVPGISAMHGASGDDRMVARSSTQILGEVRLAAIVPPTKDDRSATAAMRARPARGIGATRSTGVALAAFASATAHGWPDWRPRPPATARGYRDTTTAPARWS